MRERNLFHLLLGLNVALAGAFVAYLFLAHSGQPKVRFHSFSQRGEDQRHDHRGTGWMAKAGDRKTNPPPAALRGTTKSKPMRSHGAAPAKPKPAFTDKKFTWEQVESEEYPNYLASLRAVGCPEERVRNIALADINELFAKKRVKAAVEHDTQWWRSESEYFDGQRAPGSRPRPWKRNAAGWSPGCSALKPPRARRATPCFGAAYH